MPESITLLGGDDVRAKLEQIAPLNRTRLLVLAYDKCSAEQDVSAGATALVKQLRGDAPLGVFEQTRTLVVTSFPPAGTDDGKAFKSAAIQSLRGIVQSVTREFTHQLQPLNLLVLDNDNLGAAEFTLNYLDDPDGGYTAGVTLNLSDSGSARERTDHRSGRSDRLRHGRHLPGQRGAGDRSGSRRQPLREGRECDPRLGEPP